MDNKYFEGILQLRNPDSQVIDFVNNAIEKKEGVFIAKKVNVVNGIDLYLSSQKFLQSLGLKLKRAFNGVLKISRKLHTVNKQTSKRVYRVNVLFRLPKVKKGDRITIRGEDIEIIGLGKKVLGKSVETGKKIRIDYEDLP